MKRYLQLFAPIVLALISVFSVAQDQSGVLPKAFAGWTQASLQTSTDAAAADQIHADLLKEFGFATLDSAIYTRDDRKIAVKAIRFHDATGAYGSFTFYKEPKMQTETIGDQGASANERVMFYRGNILVDVRMDRITAMTAGELRELASLLPAATGPAKNLPTLPTYLPKQGYVAHSAKYFVGPTGLSQTGGPISADLVNFTQGAEVVLGRYSTPQGAATMMLVAYPTPAIAGERQRAIEAATQNGTGAADPTMAGRLAIKRTGPMLAMISGQISEGEAKSLLAAVNYDADVTWNEQTSHESIGEFLLGEAMLVLIVLGCALVFGLGFAGVRLYIKKKYPGKVFDRPQDMEIIELKLRE